MLYLDEKVWSRRARLVYKCGALLQQPSCTVLRLYRSRVPSGTRGQLRRGEGTSTQEAEENVRLYPSSPVDKVRTGEAEREQRTG